ncbi:MAG: hypothetical protein U5L72_11220 [Bacteroidales bacterium]|nr:hypothetical protein [Bacteroidales bacterium]
MTAGALLTANSATLSGAGSMRIPHGLPRGQEDRNIMRGAGGMMRILLGETRPSGNPGYVKFTSAPNESEPEYHVHFTLARIEDGQYKTLDFGYGLKISDMPGVIELDPGLYMLTTGNRDENGNVLASVSFITLDPGGEVTIRVDLYRVYTAEQSLRRKNQPHGRTPLLYRGED